ncbi:Ulp1 protease family carboxy-terminal domain protein, partial [Trifolium medium]|nr:Ulp1 protease family carboxy-terminal domain protein [Trifolium medium]
MPLEHMSMVAVFVVKDDVLLLAITLEERKLMQQSLMETLKSIGFSQTAYETKKVVEECSPKVIVNGSVKVSCSAAPANIKGDANYDSDSVQKLLCMIVKRKAYLP